MTGVYGDMTRTEKSSEETKSIAQELEQIANDICMHYCRWPELWDEEAKGCELSESDICAKCPLMRLV